MIAFYLFLFGCYFYYAGSKYFPAPLFRQRTFPSRIFPLIFIAGLAVNIFYEGWVSGILLSLVSCSLAAMLIQFTAVLGKKYFFGLAFIVHTLVIIDIIS